MELQLRLIYCQRDKTDTTIVLVDRSCRESYVTVVYSRVCNISISNTTQLTGLLN